MADRHTYRSFRNPQPTEEENTQPMTDEQSHSSELTLADENPGALTGEGAGIELAEALGCDPGDEDGQLEVGIEVNEIIGEPTSTEGETLTA
jgi:hypothetical protein